ncbi:molybdopterin molybdotransferase MoeA [Methanonatronarchaeum sp. AMET6-2]|uniref:molybdopterin molybdotransferase MoeA n=1 Tax=Methanonatronarchaeum sp. AMET6-2 TaxID=2933293 RepID=UPI0012053515|nr:molybdopterin molybdotransferase MoeA [Methanonatronarchaeum sp. AMET6-2]RZN62642.1 MAG: molybdopterin molybdenumtransferase MoeA [Methanonatronarchaeia archaeon]UOY10044.1 molybdopterin molybdotransferase MoeA [Methanonatronarchaeum sp. AMET6-2]
MNKKNGFQKLTNPDKALERYLKKIKPTQKTEKIKITESLGRTIAENIESSENIPHYNRSAMDGYAVKAKDTYGSTQTNPNQLNITKEKPQDGECRHVHTGSEIPPTTNAVIKIEETEKTGNKIKTYRPVSPGENVSPIGEDVKKGQKILEKGHKLRPIDLGLLRTIRKEEIKVKKKPTTLIIPTGNEVIPPNQKPEPGQVIESNSITIANKIKKWGGKPKTNRITPDNPDKISQAIKQNLNHDIITVIGGSSVGERDHTSTVIKKHGEIITEGIAMKPGKPTILGKIKETPVIGLPGYPVAAAISANTFLKPSLHKKTGTKPTPTFTIQAKLTRKIHSEPGYRTHTRVKLKNGEATPIRTGGAGIITSITQADGIAIINEDSEGKDKGEIIEVTPLD